MLDYFHNVPPARPTLLHSWCVALNIGLLIAAQSNPAAWAVSAADQPGPKQPANP